ncbi:MAG TPA: fatty acid desaturase family protein [Candidatus Dormibacteraeota bacterium]|nr:fatty acid desaturase family protein [Candidatus Dormibacteraeota bacterium]
MDALASTPQTATPPAWRAALSPEEIHDLLHVRNWRAWLSVATNWGVIFAAFALVAAWPNPLTIVAALFLIGTRQLGGAALMHDAAHRALFRQRGLNDWVGNWLCAYPIWSDTDRYRPYHLQHHAHTGTAQDPDLALVRPFPVTRVSLRRKLWRDLSGQTGRKFARAAFARTFARYREDAAARRAARGVLVTNLVLFAILAAAGHPTLYLLWVIAWLTTHTLVTRIRFIAEHGMTPDLDDPLRNTRTVLPSWWERLLIVPNRLNFHLEHHLLMTVPHYNLARMHRLLRDRGALDDACVERHYLSILARAGSRVAA